MADSAHEHQLETVDAQESNFLKPVHILVMVITLLHAIAIAVWSLVFLSSSKCMYERLFLHFFSDGVPPQ